MSAEFAVVPPRAKNGEASLSAHEANLLFFGSGNEKANGGCKCMSTASQTCSPARKRFQVFSLLSVSCELWTKINSSKSKGTNLSVGDVILDGRVQWQVVERCGRQDPSHVDQLFQRDQFALDDLLEFLRADEIILKVAGVSRRAGRRVKRRRGR